MSLAHHYAAVLEDGDTPAVEQTVAYMKTKGHLPLLPKVVRLLECAALAGDTVLVAKDADTAGARAKFASSRIVVDSRVVGGYLAKTGGAIIDATYRRALVTVYKRAVGS